MPKTEIDLTGYLTQQPLRRSWCCTTVDREVWDAMEPAVINEMLQSHRPPHWRGLTRWFHDHGYPEATQNRIRGHFFNHVDGFHEVHRSTLGGDQ